MAAKRLEKSIDGTKIQVKEVESGEMRTFDFAKLPPDIQKKFGPFGLSHKIGDSTAGKKGKEAVESMDKVWKGLMAGDWSVRAPAAPKVTKKELREKVDKMSDKDKSAAMALLEKLGVSI